MRPLTVTDLSPQDMRALRDWLTVHTTADIDALSDEDVVRIYNEMPETVERAFRTTARRFEAECERLVVAVRDRLGPALEELHRHLTDTLPSSEDGCRNVARGMGRCENTESDHAD